jgi:hypothetical protein
MKVHYIIRIFKSKCSFIVIFTIILQMPWNAPQLLSKLKISRPSGNKKTDLKKRKCKNFVG